MAEAEAERARLQHLHSIFLAKFTSTFEELCHYRPENPRAEVQQENLTRLSYRLAKQALKIEKLHEEGGAPSARAIENCMQRILTLHRGVIRNIKRSLSSAQETLSGTLKDSANEITDALLDLLGYATIRTLDGSGNGGNVPHLVNRVFEAYVSLSDVPATNATAVRRALSKIATDIEDAVHELKELEKEDAATGKEDASASQETIEKDAGVELPSQEASDEESTVEEGPDEELSHEEKRDIAELAVQVMVDMLPVVRELVRCFVVWDDTDMLFMESLLRKWTRIRDSIIEIKVRLFPLREVDEINKVISGVRKSVNLTDLLLRAIDHRTYEFNRDIKTLKGSIEQLNLGLGELLPHLQATDSQVRLQGAGPRN